MNMVLQNSLKQLFTKATVTICQLIKKCYALSKVTQVYSINMRQPMHTF